MNNKSCGYRPIASIGSNMYSPTNNPLTYCLGDTVDRNFLHGGAADTLGQHSKHCQLFMSEYCAEGWDEICEYASLNNNIDYPNNFQLCNGASQVASKNTTAGEVLLRNTAARKYLVTMGNCVKQYQPFDPNVAMSPLISSWSNGTGASRCIPVYAVDPSTIDQDIVMSKLLMKPQIAIDILTNIFNTMKRQNTLQHLEGTKLGKFYAINPYFNRKL